MEKQKQTLQERLGDKYFDWRNQDDNRRLLANSSSYNKMETFNLLKEVSNQTYQGYSKGINEPDNGINPITGKIYFYFGSKYLITSKTKGFAGTFLGFVYGHIHNQSYESHEKREENSDFEYALNRFIEKANIIGLPLDIIEDQEQINIIYETFKDWTQENDRKLPKRKFMPNFLFGKNLDKKLFEIGIPKNILKTQEQRDIVYKAVIKGIDSQHHQWKPYDDYL